MKTFIRRKDGPFHAVWNKKASSLSCVFLLADLFLIFIHAKFITGSKLIFISNVERDINVFLHEALHDKTNKQNGLLSL